MKMKIVTLSFVLLFILTVLATATSVEATHDVTVQIRGLDSSETVKVSIHDLNGTLVEEKVCRCGDGASFDLDAGTYYARAEWNGQVAKSETFYIGKAKVVTVTFDQATVLRGRVTENLALIVTLTILVASLVWLSRTKSEKQPSYIPKLP